jgi:hypothetical protein
LSPLFFFPALGTVSIDFQAVSHRFECVGAANPFFRLFHRPVTRKIYYLATGKTSQVAMMLMPIDVFIV